MSQMPHAIFSHLHIRYLGSNTLADNHHREQAAHDHGDTELDLPVYSEQAHAMSIISPAVPGPLEPLFIG